MKEFSNPVSDDAYLVMCKKAGLSDAITAARLNRSEEWVRTRWQEILSEAVKASTNGYLGLIQHWTILCHQYQLLGESMKVVALAVDATAGVEDLIRLGLSREQAGVVLENYMVLKPFIPVDPTPPENSLKEN